MSVQLVEFAGPFIGTLVVASLSLGLVVVIRSGGGDSDRRSALSAAASALGWLGICCLPVLGVLTIWHFGVAAMEQERYGPLLGVLLGVLGGLLIMGRSALRRQAGHGSRPGRSRGSADF